MNEEFSPVEVGHRFTGLHSFDEAQVRAFAHASGDTNPLHHDQSFARATRFGCLIASGAHTTALLLGLTASHFSRTHSIVGISFSVELRRPVRADATVSMEWEVTAATLGDRGSQRLTLRGAMRDELGQECVAALGTVQVRALVNISKSVGVQDANRRT